MTLRQTPFDCVPNATVQTSRPLAKVPQRPSCRADASDSKPLGAASRRASQAEGSSQHTEESVRYPAATILLVCQPDRRRPLCFRPSKEAPVCPPRPPESRPHRPQRRSTPPLPTLGAGCRGGGPVRRPHVRADRGTQGGLTAGGFLWNGTVLRTVGDEAESYRRRPGPGSGGARVGHRAQPRSARRAGVIGPTSAARRAGPVPRPLRRDRGAQLQLLRLPHARRSPGILRGRTPLHGGGRHLRARRLRRVPVLAATDGAPKARRVHLRVGTGQRGPHRSLGSEPHPLRVHERLPA